MIRKIKNLKKDTKITLYSLLGVVLLFFLWWMLSAIIKSTLFPSPIVVFPAFFTLLGKASTYRAIGGTFIRLLISFGISFILGLALGSLAGYFYRFEAIMKPIVEFLRTLPTAAVVLILVVLLKPVWTPIIVTTLVMFPLFYQAFNNGIKNIEKNTKDELTMDNASIFNSLFKVYIPLTSPYIILAIVQSLGLGMKVSIMAEILGGSNDISGLGRLIHNEASVANATNVMAYSLVAILIIVIIDALFHYLKKVLKKHER